MRAPASRRARAAARRGQPATPYYAQGFVLSLNLPGGLHSEEPGGDDGLLAWVGDNPATAPTPVDTLFEHCHDDPWTAPPRADAGDVVFYHCAARLPATARALRRQAAREGLLTDALATFFDRADNDAGVYAGRVFAFGVLTGPTEYFAPDPAKPLYFRSRQFAPVGEIRSFGTPLELREHEDVLPRPHSALTPLTARQFEALKERLTLVGNQDEALLDGAIPGRDEVDRITAATWRREACAPEQQFASESQLRGAFADHLLSTIADEGTPVYEEVRCVTPGRRGVPVADYLVRLFGEWLPVEAKLNTRAWPNLLWQVGNYLGVGEYSARGAGRARVSISAAAQADRALVVDKRGLYAVRAGAFTSCSLTNPLWVREEIGPTSRDALRRRVADALALPMPQPRRRGSS